MDFKVETILNEKVTFSKINKVLQKILSEINEYHDRLVIYFGGKIIVCFNTIKYCVLLNIFQLLQFENQKKIQLLTSKWNKDSRMGNSIIFERLFYKDLINGF